MARVSQPAISGNRHQDRQTEESIGTEARSGADPQGKRRTVAVLGPHGPGSEGNLASDIENTTEAVTTTPPQEKQDKPAERPPARPVREQNAVPPRDGGAVAEPPVDKPAEKPVERVVE